MPVRKGSKILGASPGLSNKDTLGDDETRLARWDQMTAAEKARVRAREKAELKEAESERKRPLSSRIMGGLFTPLQRAKEVAAEDTSRRESRYREAKETTSKSDKDRTKLYPVDRKIKLRKGGSVSASRRGDGIARKGKTRGKVC
jgi:hypothetical protein